MPWPRRELLGVVQEFEVLKEVGVCQVPLIFLLVQGSAAPRDDLAELDRLGSASVEMTRTILSMPQPIYGLALGETLGISTRGCWELETATGGAMSFNFFGSFELFSPSYQQKPLYIYRVLPLCAEYQPQLRISSTGAMILDACDCILSDLPHENLVSRVLHPNEIALAARWN
jgi:hypothetical protein